MVAFDAAIVREQDVEFTVVSVKSSAVSSTSKSREVMSGLSRYFPGRPIVLAAKVGSRMQFTGRRDIVDWLANVELYRLPWRRYTFND